MRDHEPTRREVLRLGAALPVLASAPMVLKMQPARPKPTGLIVAHVDGDWTAITRTWAPGTTGAACGRCPRAACGLHNGVCLVVAPGFVPDRQCAEYATDAMEASS